MTLLSSSIFLVGKAGYLPLMLLVGALVVFAVWRGRSALKPVTLKLVYTAIAAFFIARLSVAGSDTLGLQTGVHALATFSFFSLITYFCFAGALLGLPRAPNDKETRPSGPVYQLDEKASKLFLQISFFGVGAGLLLLLYPNASSMPTLILNLLHLVFVGATIRIIAFVFHEARWRLAKKQVCGVGCVAFVTAPWLLYQISSLLPPQWNANILTLARTVDLTVVSFVLLNILVTYIRMGEHYRSQAIEQQGEMDAAKTELTKVSNIVSNMYEDNSDLIKQQRERTLLFMKKVESLEKIVQIGITIQQNKKLDALLQQVVDLIKENLGFRTVTLRLYNPKAQNFETKAWVGLSNDVRDKVLNYRIPLSEYKKIIDPRFRISNSYFIHTATPWQGEELGNGGSVLVESAWAEADILIVPLQETGETFGYLVVENPEDAKLAVSDVVENLEDISALALIAIQNASFFKELEEKNEKLRGYAEKLAGLNKLKANFVATISHEFRTPLTSIRAYCDTLLKNAEDVDPELMKHFLMVIDDESGRLTTLIDDILNFSQMESGAIKFERTPCSLNRVIQSTTQELAKNFEAKRLDLDMRLPGYDVQIRAEEDLIRQLMVNLLHNASKFSREGGTVRVTLEDEIVTTRITVEDQGIGIPEDQLEKIFEQFHQADSSSTREYGGSGLGLAICKNIADWHDGRIWVENVARRGARFVVVLPKKQVIVKSHLLASSSTVRRYEIERFLELLVENVAEMMHAAKASIMLFDEETNELRIESAIGLDEEVVEHARVKLGDGIAGRVAKEGRTMLVTNIETDTRVHRSNNDPMYGSKSFLSVPIMNGNSVVGVVNVSSPTSKPAFDDGDGQLLELLVSRLQIAIERMKSFATASVSYEQVRETFKAILESKRFIDLQNDDLVDSLAITTAIDMGLDDKQVSTLRYALNVYDLGLSKIGYHIIKKPTDLSPKERREIEKHALFGKDMLEVVETIPEIKDIVLSHHENFDGSGYPRNLKGDAIPVVARIIRVADSLKALISKRSYQRQHTLLEAAEVLGHRSGTFFDPEVVEQFIESIRKHESTRNTPDAKSSDELVKTSNLSEL